MSKNGRFKVIGESYVAIYDGTRWSSERDTIYQLPKGSKEFYFLKAGDEYDLAKKKVITFNDREFINLTEDHVSNYVGSYKLKGKPSTIEIFTKNGEVYIRQNWNGVEFQILP